MQEIEANNQSNIIIYQAQDGELSIDVKLDNDTVWLSQRQIAQLFNKDIRTINEHILNLYEEAELEPNPTIRNFRIVQNEGVA